jgi:hypothetical protein
MPLANREYLETKYFPPSLGEQQHDRRWHSVFTLPQNEKSVVKHLEIREVESFLPTYETIRLWKNRLQSPGVLAIVGKNREPAPMLRRRTRVSSL